MAFFTRSSARHRAQTTSRAVRTTTVAAAAGAAVIGSIAPAQAYAEIPTAPTTYAAPVSAVTSPASNTYQAPAAPQAASVSSVTTQAVDDATTTTDTAVGATGSASDRGLVATAMQGEGTGYVWGGTAFGAWDCSGFTKWVYAQNGIEIPRTSFQQIAAATPTTAPQPGDLVSMRGGNHIGIYIGGGKMISALNPTQGTFVHSVNDMPLDGYYTYR